MRTLPPLPGSSDQDLRENRHDPFFRKTPRQVWEGAEIEHNTLKEKEKCDHFFEHEKDGVICIRCGIGLQGQLDIQDGKLYTNKQRVL